MEAYIRPLKIKDSVPKYRVPIQMILDGWLEDDAALLAMANAALLDRRKETLDACRSDLLEKIFWIKDRYDSMESDYLEEIDRQVRRYTRAATQKIENLTNRDQNIRGNLNYLLTALSRNSRAGETVEAIQEVFQLPEQSFLSEKSLWFRKRPGKREKSAPILLEEENPDEAALQELHAMLHARYGKSAVEVYMRQRFGASEICYSKDLGLEDDHAYIMSLLAALEDGSGFYRIESLPGIYKSGTYTMPQLRFVRKEGK